MADTFELHSPYKPSGDQPQAIAKLVQGIREGKKHQTLLGQQEREKLLPFRMSLKKSINRRWSLPIIKH